MISGNTGLKVHKPFSELYFKLLHYLQALIMTNAEKKVSN